MHYVRLLRLWMRQPISAIGVQGTGQDFEASYFARRRMLNALVLAECVEHQGRFLDRIIDGLLLICEESGWQLPAHNSQQRGGQRRALPE